MSWPKVRLGDVCEFRRGLTYSKGDEVEVSSNVVLRSNNVDLDTGLMVYDELKYISNDFEIPDDKRVVADSVLMCMANGSKAHLGKVGYIEKDLGYAFGGFMGLLVPKGVVGKYLYWVLSSASFKKLIQGLTAGANINNLRFAAIKDFEIPLPPLAEQKKIVEKVEKALKRVDALKAQFERMEKSAADYFKAALAETFAVVKGEKVKLGDVCENCDSKRIPITKSDRRAGAFPYYGASGVVDHVDQYIFDGDFLLVSEDGANLLARSTPIAFSVSGKVWVNNHAHVLRFESMDTQRYVEYFFASIDIADCVTGAAQPKLTQNALNAILLPYPSLDVQREVVKRLTEIKCTASRLEEAARRCIGICGKMRKAILAEAFQ